MLLVVTFSCTNFLSSRNRFPPKQRTRFLSGRFSVAMPNHPAILLQCSLHVTKNGLLLSELIQLAHVNWSCFFLFFSFLYFYSPLKTSELHSARLYLWREDWPLSTGHCTWQLLLFHSFVVLFGDGILNPFHTSFFPVKLLPKSISQQSEQWWQSIFLVLLLTFWSEAFLWRTIFQNQKKNRFVFDCICI